MNWLKREIFTGLQMLLTLSLDRAPAADVIVGTAKAWYISITEGRAFDEARDAERIRKAFIVLSGRCRKWPAPGDLIDALPRIEAPKLQRRLPSDQARERAAKHIADIARMLNLPKNDNETVA